MLKKFIENEHGGTAIEYGLVAALIAVAMLAGLTAMGGEVREKYDGVSKAMDGVEPSVG